MSEEKIMLEQKDFFKELNDLLIKYSVDLSAEEQNPHNYGAERELCFTFGQCSGRYEDRNTEYAEIFHGTGFYYDTPKETPDIMALHDATIKNLEDAK